MLLLICSFLIISCKTESKKKIYFIQSKSLDSETNQNVIKDDTLEYLNDTLALLGAYQRFYVSQALEETNKLKGVKVYSTPISFDVYDSKRNVINLEIPKETLDSLKNVVFKFVSRSVPDPGIEEAPKQNIEKQFSSWNGAHKKLQKLIKQNMNDPDSYEHIETRYKNLGDVLAVETKYRGTNSFGAKVIQTTIAKCDLETGDVLTIE